MSETAVTSNAPGVVLLFEDADLSAHLRKALIDAGARIVHEGPASEASRENPAVTGADVIVVNLDDRAEAYLDSLYEIIDEGRQRLVFNDAEASSGLSGWDQARWARHLAAKLMDAHDVDPPRPAQSRPVETAVTELALPEEEMPEAPADEDSPAAEGVSDVAAESNPDLTAELEALLAEDGDLLGRFEQDTTARPAGDVALSLDAVGMDAPEQDAMAAIPDQLASAAGIAPAPEDASNQAEAVSGSTETTDNPAAESEAPDSGSSEDESAFEDTLRMFDEALAEQEAVHDADDDDALEQVTWSPGEPSIEDASGEETPRESKSASTTPETSNDDIESTEEAETDSGESPFSLVDLDDVPAADAGSNKKEALQAPEAPDWELVDFDADTPDDDTGQSVVIMDQGHRDEPVSDPAEFGIEKLSASEYLAPEDTGDGAGADIEPVMSLEIEPMEQAVAPSISTGTDSDKPDTLSEDEDEAVVRRVVVVAAGSGEEARSSVRDFVTALERIPDAVMLGIIHQQADDDLEALAQELDAIHDDFAVHVATPRERVRPGQMLLVPAGRIAILRRSGTLALSEAQEHALASPSIDLSLTRLAQAFGPDVLAIVLAGDAIDALAGAQAIRDGGGAVWALDPDVCSDNTMVAVIGEEHLAQHTGTVAELAARLIEEGS